MARRGHLEMPVIGVAKDEWNLERLRNRVRESLIEYGGLDEQAFAKLSGLLRYVSGDYREKATFERLRAELGGAGRPLYYLAIPPSLFPVAIEGLAQAGC